MVFPMVALGFNFGGGKSSPAPVATSELGVTAPLGFFDPLNLAAKGKESFLIV